MRISDWSSDVCSSDLTPVSLYVHIPFCESICWYCGCNTGAAGRKQRLDDYLTALRAEIALVAKRLGGRGRIRRIAFGGGSPYAIAPVEPVRLLELLRTVCHAPRPAVSLEIGSASCEGRGW